MPFSDIYKQLFGLGGGYPGTPPFNPAGTGVPGGTNTPFPIGVGGDPGVDPMGGMITPEMQQAAKRQGLLSFGASLLQASAPRTGPRVGLGAALGDAILAGQQGRQGSLDNELQRMLLVAKLQETKNGGPKVREYQFAKQNGFTGTYQEFLQIGQGGIGNFNPGDYTPESFAKFQQTGNTADLQRYVAPSNPTSAIQEAEYFAKLTPEQQKQYLEVKRAQATPFVQAEQGGATGAFDRRSGSFTQQVAPEQNQAAAAALKAAEAGGATAGKLDTERAATFQQDLNVIDDEILRTQRLLTEFQGGKYQTGPIAGRLPSLRDAAQNLEREQGRDVLKNISAATFGALSEGEREFLKGIGIDPNRNEGSNISYLEEKLSTLQKAKQRLVSRPPVEPPRPGARSQSDAAPNTGSRPPLSSFRR